MQLDSAAQALALAKALWAAMQGRDARRQGAARARACACASFWLDQVRLPYIGSMRTRTANQFNFLT